MRYLILCLFFTLGINLVQAQTWRPTPTNQEGFATYYADRFHGRQTAYGERYDRAAFTCASKDFPKNSLLRVTRLDTRESVVVRVNDRGPFGKESYIIDLSYAAAAKIDMIRDGRVQVTVEKIGTSSSNPAPARTQSNNRRLLGNRNSARAATSVSVTPAARTASSNKKGAEGVWRSGKQNTYGVQLAAYTQRTLAQQQAEKWIKMGLSDLIIWQESNNSFKLIAGSFSSRQQAAGRMNTIRRIYSLEGFVKYY